MTDQDQVKIFLDRKKGAYGINDVNELQLVMPVFSTEENARRYVREMGWTIYDDDLRDRYNNLMVTIRCKYEEFLQEFGTPPTHVLLSEYSYNTALAGNSIVVKTINKKDTSTLMGMGILVDRGNWKSRIQVGIMR